MDRTQTKNWINFKDLRSRLSFPAVLEQYGVTLTTKGDQLVGFCPLPAHNGKKNSPSFSAHPEKGIFQCFGCGAKGNVLDFAVLMDKGDPKRGLDVRKTALKLNKLGSSPVVQSKLSASVGEKPVVVNEPLSFRLSDLDPEHPYLQSRGFTRQTMEHFGVGFCSKGIFAGRITIPLYDAENELIGYAGRVIDDSTVGPDTPKYLFPGKREQDGKALEFKKSLFLYNGSRFTEPLNDLIIVEGFTSVWWLTQCGYAEVVALMGSTYSREQLDLIFQIVSPKGNVWVMTDGDKAGERCGLSLCEALVPNRFCRLLLEPERQPTDYTVEELQGLLGR
jgi:DNA primase